MRLRFNAHFGCSTMTKLRDLSFLVLLEETVLDTQVHRRTADCGFLIWVVVAYFKPQYQHLCGGASRSVSTACCVERLNKCPVGTKRSKRETDHIIHLVWKSVARGDKIASTAYAHISFTQDATISRQPQVHGLRQSRGRSSYQLHI